MIHLYYYTWYLHITAYGTVIDDIEEQPAEHEIFLISCDGDLLPCTENRGCSSVKCSECRFIKNAGIRTTSRPIKHLKLHEYFTLTEAKELFETQNFKYDSVEELKRITYKKTQIGYGAFSSYVTWTRNHQPEFNDVFRSEINKMLVSQIFIKEAVDKIIQHLKPGIITIFNGRRADVRPVYDTALHSGIQLRNLENFKTNAKDLTEIRKEVYINALPQSVVYHGKRIEEAWENSRYTEQEKQEIARKFFEGRRGFKAIRQKKAYIEGQDVNSLPQNFDKQKRNIAIFNSSEDEKASLGPEYEALNLFSDQEEGINYILSQKYDDDIHFYLRVHPNLKHVAYGFHTRLYDLEKKYANVTVIHAKDPVSTYSLMDLCEKVVVFNSSMGVEASYWGKPVIILGAAEYYEANVGYIPDNKEAIRQLINADLKPVGTAGALKYGYYKYDSSDYSTPIKYSPKHATFFGRKMGYLFPHLKLAGSMNLFKTVLSLYRKLS